MRETIKYPLVRLERLLTAILPYKFPIFPYSLYSSENSNYIQKRRTLECANLWAEWYLLIFSLTDLSALEYPVRIILAHWTIDD